MEAIKNSTIYAIKAVGQSLRLYYLISWNSYSKAKNTLKLAFAVMQFLKIINTFHKDHSVKPTIMSLPIDSVLFIAKPSAIKRK